MREYNHQYNIDHSEKIKEQRKKYRNNKNKTDLKYRLNKIMRKAIWESLRGNKNGRHWENLVKYTLEDLMKRLKETMPENYTWQDYLDGRLQIDHIIPIKAFAFQKSEEKEFMWCWSLTNLRLLPTKENLIKGGKIL